MNLSQTREVLRLLLGTIIMVAGILFVAEVFPSEYHLLLGTIFLLGGIIVLLGR